MLLHACCCAGPMHATARAHARAVVHAQRATKSEVTCCKAKSHIVHWMPLYSLYPATHVVCAVTQYLGHLANGFRQIRSSSCAIHGGPRQLLHNPADLSTSYPKMHTLNNHVHWTQASGADCLYLRDDVLLLLEETTKKLTQNSLEAYTSMFSKCYCWATL